jgi:hypothetical protein
MQRYVFEGFHGFRAHLVGFIEGFYRDQHGDFFNVDSWGM